MNLAACDYYQGVGICSFGCSDEPECQTCEPDEGWPTVEFPPYEAFLMSARRLSYRMERSLGWALTFSKETSLGRALQEHGLVNARFGARGISFPAAASGEQTQ